MQVFMDKDVNIRPVSWVYDALAQNKICGSLHSLKTLSSGINDKYHINGSRDTIVVIPKNVKLAQHVDILYWFHGLTGFKKRTFETRLIPQFRWLVKERKIAAILVVTEMPWSRFTRTQWRRQGRVFKRKNEFLYYALEVENRVLTSYDDMKKTYYRIIVGHSAGGSAIASAAKYGGLCKLRPSGVIFSDATYGSWFTRAWYGCLSPLVRKKQTRLIVLGQSFGTPWKRFIHWAQRNKATAGLVEAYRLPLPWTHSRIGDNAIPFFYNGFQNEVYVDILAK